MYPAAKTVMRNPIPQTTQSMVAVSESKKYPHCATNEPASIQVKQMLRAVSSPPRCQICSICASRQNERSAEKPTPIQIGQCDRPFSHLAPKKPATIAPSNGARGIRNEY